MSKPLEDAIVALDVYLRDVLREKNEPLNQERLELHKYVIQVIHHTEGYLGWALNGSRLRGAHNLLTNDCPLWGWNVRKDAKHGKIRLPDQEGEEGIVEALLLSHDAVFTIAEIRLVPGTQPAYERVRFDLCDPEDDDFKVEDLPHCLRTIYIACGQHLAQSSKTADTTFRLRRLVDSMSGALLDYRRWGAGVSSDILRVSDKPIKSAS